MGLELFATALSALHTWLGKSSTPCRPLAPRHRTRATQANGSEARRKHVGNSRSFFMSDRLSPVESANFGQQGGSQALRGRASP
jgi:hypothetical protein